MTSEEMEAVEAFLAYSRAFETLDPEAVRPYYHEPCLLISPQGVMALNTQDEVAGFFRGLMRDLRERGYARSEFVGLQARWLGDDLSVVSGMGIWLTQDGEELQRFGLTYTFRKLEGSWKIAVAVVHDPIRKPQDAGSRGAGEVG